MYSGGSVVAFSWLVSFEKRMYELALEFVTFCIDVLIYSIYTRHWMVSKNLHVRVIYTCTICTIGGEA